MTETHTPGDQRTSAAHAAGGPPGSQRLVELSHVIVDRMITLPNLPGPEITTHLSREDSRASYTPGTTFEIGRINMVANTGTYLDSPHHRFESGVDLAGVRLEQVADLPAVVVSAVGTSEGAITTQQLKGHDVEGCAVLLHTGDDARFGTPGYVQEASFLSRDGAQWLVDHGATLVGIDAANIDDMGDGERPAHTLILAAGIPIVEHLTGLEQLPTTGARFTAVPPLVADFGTFPVRAFAAVPA